jgi:hypothetical protein
MNSPLLLPKHSNEKIISLSLKGKDTMKMGKKRPVGFKVDRVIYLMSVNLISFFLLIKKTNAITTTHKSLEVESLSECY